MHAASPSNSARAVRRARARGRVSASALVILLGAVATAGGSRAHAGTLDLAVGLDAGASAWSEDSAVGHSLIEVGYRFWKPWFELHGMSRLGYASVDQRLLEQFGVGVELRAPHLWRLAPYVRADLVHQHEEPRTSWESQPLQSLLGVGDGLRHRGGGSLGAGLELPFYHHAHGWFYAAADLDTTWFPDDRGPAWYVEGGLALGFTYDFDRGGGGDGPRATAR